MKLNKEKKIYWLILGLALLMPSYLHSQQIPLYSQYTFNGFLINPAIAGSEGYTALNLTAREQWLGIPNSPKTHAVSIQTRMLRDSYIGRSLKIKKRMQIASRSGRVGLGGYVYNDMSGLIIRTGFQLTYGYHIRMKESQLSLGVSVNAYEFRINRQAIVTGEEDDPLILETKFNTFVPDANFGVYYVNRYFYAGASVSDMMQAALKLSGPATTQYKLMRHYFLMAGYKAPVADNFTLEPSFLLKASQNGAVQLDIGSKVYYKEDYWAGMAYRTGNALIFMLGMKVDKYYFGYAFDYSLSHIMSRTFGTHEFMVAAKFGDNARRYRWLNRF